MYNVSVPVLKQAFWVFELAGVRAATAVGVPSAEREHDIHVRVEGDVDADAVRQWCQRRLAAYKQPASIEIVA